MQDVNTASIEVLEKYLDEVVKDYNTEIDRMKKIISTLMREELFNTSCT